MQRNHYVSLRTCNTAHLAQILKLLDFSQTLVREEYQVIIFAPNQEKLRSCHEYLENIKIQVKELKVPVFGGAKLLMLSLDSFFDLANYQAPLSR